MQRKQKREFTAKLICAFVFAYANCWFSHAVRTGSRLWPPGGGGGGGGGGGAKPSMRAPGTNYLNQKRCNKLRN